MSVKGGDCLKTLKSTFTGCSMPSISVDKNQLIVNGTDTNKFNFYNTNHCIVKINNSKEIFLFKGQGFSIEKDLIFSFEVINQLANKWNDSMVWDDSMVCDDSIKVNNLLDEDVTEFNYMAKTI